MTILTVSSNQQEIIQNIISLYCPTGIECDTTYSKGVFYKGLAQPRLKFDLCPQTIDTVQADCRRLPLTCSSITSLMFDPPFTIGVGRQGKPGIIRTRFSSYATKKELLGFYYDSIKEFFRVLTVGGVLIIKCQDTVSCSRQHLNHVDIVNYAVSCGFEPLDLFVLLNMHPIIDPRWKGQQHARKAHSYFLVFRRVEVKYGLEKISEQVCQVKQGNGQAV